MNISNELQTFIEENIDLMEKNTKKSWEEIYDRLSDRQKGEFTQVMLEIEVDPAAVLGYIPKNYLGYSAIEEYEIPNNVTSIGNGAFIGCESLTNIEIPNSVTSIGDRAFEYCKNLKSITIPDSVTSIGWAAFYKCSSLKSIVIPDSVINIILYAFAYCSSLTSVTIPNNAINMDGYVFSNCTSLTEIIYLGTTEEASILLDDETWTFDSAIKKIICNDGEILL